MFNFGCGGRIRTYDLQVMSLTSYQTAPPREKKRPALAHYPPARVWCLCKEARDTRAVARPGSDLLSHILRCSTIGAEGFHGRVRNGIGCFAPRHNHQAMLPHRYFYLTDRQKGRILCINSGTCMGALRFCHARHESESNQVDRVIRTG